jgi:hypothetical protein
MSPMLSNTLLLGSAEKARAADVALLDPATVLNVVHNSKRDLNVREMIQSIEIERTMSGASTVTFTFLDPDRRLLQAPALKYALEISMDNWGYRLYAINKTGPILTLTFEDKAVAFLRQKKHILVTASRNKLTRVQFCQHLISRVKATDIRVIAPEADIKQRIKTLPNSDKGKLVDSREPGINENEELTVKGVKATKAQIKLAERVLAVGAEEQATNKVQIAAMMTIIGESTIKNEKLKFVPGIRGTLVPADSGSYGLFRQRPASDWPPYDSSVEVQARAFYKGYKTNIGAIQVADENPEMMAWEIAAEVQRPREDLRQSTYDPWKTEATKWVDAFSGGGAGSDTSFRGRYTFSTKNDNGKIEDFWTVIVRLMDEVQWAAFAQQGAIFLVREAYLSGTKPVMIVSPDSPGVDDIDLDWNINKKDAKATVRCYAHRWDAPAGSCVKLADMGEGPDATRWLVDSISRTYDDPLTTIELRTAEHSLPEPAPEIITVALGDKGPNISGSDVHGMPDAIAAAYRAAQQMDKKQYPYAWGGGHEHAGSPSRHAATSHGGPVVLGYDCSGSTGALLAAAEPYVKGSKGFGLPKKGDPVIGSGDFGNYGVFGEGKYMTWWYNDVHVFVEFKRPDNTEDDGAGGTQQKVEHFGTGRWGKSWSGPGFNDELHPHDGFFPAHIPGM